MCGKPGKGRHGTSHHAKAIYQIIKSFLPVEAEISVTKVFIREGVILQSLCPSVCSSVHTFVKDVSAATGRNDFNFDT
jgi:hypothetical protein